MRVRFLTRFDAAAFAVCVSVMSGCVAGHNPLTPLQRPSVIAGEWVDVDRSTPMDTTLWVLRADGYDGVAHLRLLPDSGGPTREVREESRYGSWYLDGQLGDTTHQAICFSRRIGRFGATCTSFVMDTITAGSRVTPRLLLRAYRGLHHTRDRVLMARTAWSP